jgi:L-ascorbate metabolism protein UlaG (beta-lactamase superfamily)
MAIGRDTRFTWLGHAGVEIATPGGQVVLVDPWYGNPNSPHAVDAQARCDVLCLTHGYFDHFDADTLSLARRLTRRCPASTS